MEDSEELREAIARAVAAAVREAGELPDNPFSHAVGEVNEGKVRVLKAAGVGDADASDVDYGMMAEQFGVLHEPEQWEWLIETGGAYAATIVITLLGPNALDWPVGPLRKASDMVAHGFRDGFLAGVIWAKAQNGTE